MDRHNLASAQLSLRPGGRPPDALVGYRLTKLYALTPDTLQGTIKE